MNQSDKEKILRAGKIVADIRKYVPTIVKKGTPLIEIAEKIEAKTIELGGKPAFPVNLSIDNIAAHYTPSHDDKTLAHGLLKVDFGVQIDGWPADNSMSFDLENDEENRKMIKAAEDALHQALELLKKRVDKLSANELGGIIQNKIESRGFFPIVNLCGHSMERNDLHAGITIPNIDDGRSLTLKPGLYAIEPFATNGKGRIREGKSSGIYALINERTPRTPAAREVLNFIKDEYETLPFCSRWLVKKLGSRALLGLKQLEENGNLHHFPQLIETSDNSNVRVSQAEHTVLIEKDKVTVTTL